MNTVTKPLLGQLPASGMPTASRSTTATQTLATVMLAAGVAALVVVAAQMIEAWAASHEVAAWLALWAVAALAIGLLRGVTRNLAYQLMTGLDAWSAQVARRRADQRLWSMAQSDPRLMIELQVACDGASKENSPAQDLETVMARRAAQLVRDRLYYI